MRDAKGSNGLCPVRDSSPPLFVENALAVTLYYEARKSAEFREVKAGSDNYKVKVFIRASDLDALMRVHDVPKSERLLMYQKVMALQNLENDLSPIRTLNGR